MQPNPVSDYNPKTIFLAEFPEVVLRAIYRHVLNAYKEAESTCEGFPWPPAHDLRPHYRRCVAESNVYNLNGRYRNVSVTYLPNEAGNCYHAVIRSTHAFLTISYVDSPNEMVHIANYRNPYCAQQDLFLHNDPPPSDADLYAILLHGPSKDDTIYPSFMRIVFPNTDCTEYATDHIDLIQRFSDIREQAPVTEEIPAPPVPRLLDIPKAEE